RRIKLPNALCRDSCFLFTQVCFPEQDTSSQVTQLNHVEVDDTNFSDSKQREILKRFISQGAGTYNEHACFRQSLLGPATNLFMAAKTPSGSKIDKIR